MFVFALTWLAVGGVSENADCQDGWAPFLIGEKIKCMAYAGNDVISNAQSICSGLGASVPVPNNEAENQDYSNAFRPFLGPDRDDYPGYTDDRKDKVAIGITDALVEGEWLDFDGNEVSYTNWDEDEPNNWNPSAGGEDYAAMRPSSDPEEPGFWTDCGDEHCNVAIICEIDSINDSGSTDCQQETWISGYQAYEGEVAVTVTGHACAGWSDHDVDGLDEYHGHNYCRNPYNLGWGAWCFTTNPEGLIFWDGYPPVEYCAVAFCQRNLTAEEEYRENNDDHDDDDHDDDDHDDDDHDDDDHDDDDHDDDDHDDDDYDESVAATASICTILLAAPYMLD